LQEDTDAGAIHYNINDQLIEDHVDSVDDQMNLSDDSAISSISAVSSGVGRSSENVRLHYLKNIVFEFYIALHSVELQYIAAN
jgi:hypothetical protein